MGAVAHIDKYKQGEFFSKDARGDMSWNGYENNVLLRSEGLGEDGALRFTDVAVALGADDILDARGVAALDFDNDGDLDLAVNHNSGDLLEQEGAPAVLLRNDIGQRRNWFAVDLVGTKSNRDAVGARVFLQAGGAAQSRLVAAGSGYASQQGRRLYFGLDRADRVAVLTVRWPSGLEESYRDLQANRLARIVEGGGIEIQPLPSVSAGDPEEPAIP